MRLRSASVAAGAALLSLFLFAAPASAGTGAVVLFEEDSVAEVYVNPDEGECHELPWVEDPTLLNATDGAIELFSGEDCDGESQGELDPGEYEQLEEVFSFQAVE